MSRTKTYMQQLDDWTNDVIIVPLGQACFEGGEAEYHEVAAEIEHAVREKVLESYRNGQQAAAARPATSFAPRQYRNH